MALNIVAWHDRTGTDHQQLRDKHSAQGFRTLSLSIYGERNDPRYASVMIKRDRIIATRQFMAMDAATWQKTFNEMAAQKMGPYIVSATGPGNDPLIAAVFRPMNGIPLTRHGISREQLSVINQEALNNGQVLQWADAYGDPNNPRYIAVWFPNPDRVRWNADAIDEDGGTLQQRFNAFTAVGIRPSHIAVTPGLRHLEVFLDNRVGAWASRAGLTSAGYQQAFDEMMGKGLAPVRVSASGSGANARFAAIFAASETIEPRTFRATGSPAVAAIDQAVEGVMKANRVRAASIAICQDTRLVYARGYTFAEASYPTVQPTTFFRQASVSKMFTGIAIYQLIEEGLLTLDTKLQDVLNLTTPSGGKPSDPNFSKITIRHLLEHRSGLNPSIPWFDVLGKTSGVPVSPAQLASICAAEMLTGVPPTTAAYNNSGYFMLSRVIAKLRNSASYISAITPNLLAPLAITRVRQAKSLRSSQAADEALHEATPLAAAPSVMSSDRPLVALAHGHENLENFEGSGGLSAAATDVARLLAALSLRDNNPMLAAASLDALFANASSAGGHGFDWVQNVDPANHVHRGVKGGALTGSQNGIYFSTGGISYAVHWAGSVPAGEAWFPVFTSVLKAAEERDWGSGDLFPSFGMPRLEGPAISPTARLKKLHAVPTPKQGFEPAEGVPDEVRKFDGRFAVPSLSRVLSSLV